MNDEDALLTAIRNEPTDNLLRLVYADYLDEHNRGGGRFLRVECQLATLASEDPTRAELQTKLREASWGVDPGWLIEVSRTSVENCGVEFRFHCPKRWENLDPTAEEGVRFCGHCRQQVFFCSSIDITQTHAALGECVAVDLRLARKPRDLESSVWDQNDVFVGMLYPNEVESDLKGDKPLPPQPSRRKRKKPAEPGSAADGGSV